MRFLLPLFLLASSLVAQPVFPEITGYTQVVDATPGIGGQIALSMDNGRIKRTSITNVLNKGLCPDCEWFCTDYAITQGLAWVDVTTTNAGNSQGGPCELIDLQCQPAYDWWCIADCKTTISATGTTPLQIKVDGVNVGTAFPAGFPEQPYVHYFEYVGPCNGQYQEEITVIKDESTFIKFLVEASCGACPRITLLETN